MNKQGTLLVISGPSGAGKGTLIQTLLHHPDVMLSVSATTRAKAKAYIISMFRWKNLNR